MTITREQVQDLQPGDVVEYRRDDWPEGCYVHSPLKVGYGVDSGLYVLDGHFGVRTPDGRPYEDMATLTVVSRAPRPLYVNHDRAKPVAGDVVRFVSYDHPDDSYTNVFLPRSDLDALPWLSLTHDPGERYSDENADCRHLSGWCMVLLVDGETGEVVP